MDYGNTLLIDIGQEIIKQLSKKYNFNCDEACKFMNFGEGLKIEKIDKIVKREKTGSVVIPFCGVIYENRCTTIRLNHGLYTQCMNQDIISFAGNRVCKTCDNQIKKNNNQPPYGYISERIDKGDSYVSSNGKSPIKYGNIMVKLNISRKNAEKEAAIQGVIISDSQYEVFLAQRGRPKKNKPIVDDLVISHEPPQKKFSKNTDATVYNESEKSEEYESDESDEPDKSDESDESDEPDKSEESIHVSPFIIKNKNYLIGKDNTIYHEISWDTIGKWNSDTKKLERY
jgi:hypothetical protein